MEFNYMDLGQVGYWLKREQADRELLESVIRAMREQEGLSRDQIKELRAEVNLLRLEVASLGGRSTDPRLKDNALRLEGE